MKSRLQPGRSSRSTIWRPVAGPSARISRAAAMTGRSANYNGGMADVPSEKDVVELMGGPLDGHKLAIDPALSTVILPGPRPEVTSTDRSFLQYQYRRDPRNPNRMTFDRIS